MYQNKYHRLIIDPLAEDSWVLDKFTEFPDRGAANLWRYSYPQSNLEAGELSVSISIPGTIMDYNLVYPNVAIVSSSFKKVLEGEMDIEFYPVKIINSPDELKVSFYLMYIKNSLDCVNESQSIYKKWEAGNSIRPDLAGQYKSITKLSIDPNKVLNHNIFKIEDFPAPIIVSNLVKSLLIDCNISGVSFID